MEKYILLFFPMLGVLWKFINPVTSIKSTGNFSSRQEVITPLFKTWAFLYHIIQVVAWILPGGQPGPNQNETQNHININDTNFDYEKILLLVYSNRNIKNMAHRM